MATKVVSTDIVLPYFDWLKSKVYGVDAQSDIYKAPFIYKNDIASGIKSLYGETMPIDVLKSPMIDGMMSYFLFSELETSQAKYIRDYTLNNIDYSVLSTSTISDFEAMKFAPKGSSYLLDKIKTTKDVVKIFQDTFDDYVASNVDLIAVAGQNGGDNLI